MINMLLFAFLSRTLIIAQHESSW